ncbi:hypothetical protein J3R30DRAFT_3419267 [Lentinula aciculospora]|uniref:Protein UNC80 C-terminal domain-containing protein n=1 Tax=Lentinula aciculospora TaxID=153920 RepID=A0A9W9AVL8_9AGAR|nr:hypothetical protein J3R30DRAFT_3419267 [Lentinula aciculospora]
MDNRGNHERRTPRRLFSFDSVRSSSTRRSSSETPYNIERKPSKGSLYTINLEQTENSGNWTLPDITESPRSVTPRSTTPLSDREKRKGPRPPLPPVVVDATARSVTPDGLPPPSPSSIRWNSLRQHVLPPSKSTHSQQSSSASLLSISTQTTASRTGHAKQSSKFARLGFRNVVDQAKQVMVDDIQQFASDIQRACMAAYHVELQPPVKSRIDPLHSTVGSTLSLPFISSTNLTAGSSGSSVSVNQCRSDVRQPSVSSTIAAGRVRPLYQTLINYAGPFSDGSSPLPQLPLESLVISTLLIPFLTTETASAMEEDRWLSIEALQIIIKTWNPTTEVVAAERSLWCMQAALSSQPPLRTRILSILWSLTVPEETHYPASDARVLQTLLHGLFLLLPVISAEGADNKDSRLLSEIISEVCAGSCDQLDDLHVEEEYNALFVDADTPQHIRDAVIIEALAKCLEYSADSMKRWFLRNSVENLWSLPEELSFTPLLTAIHSRALNSFTRALLALLLSTITHDAKLLRDDARIVVQALQSRVFPELTCITNHTTEDAKRNVVFITFHLISLEVKELVDWSISTIVEWYRQMPDWKDCFERSFKGLILESPWIDLLKILPPLMRLLPDDMRRPLTVVLLSALNSRLVDDPPPYPCLPLASLLNSLSQSYPQIFYKPLFLCAASTREHVVVNHLCTLTVLARFMPDLWIKDAEMMSVAIMGDMGMKKEGLDTAKEMLGAPKSWGTARLGQSVLIVELIAQIQNMRRIRENSSSSASDSAYIAIAKFVISLEQRLSILIETKERTNLIPLSQRLLFCMLFREIRLLTRSLKSAPWLSRFVEWFVSHHENEHLDDDSDLVTLGAIKQIKALYALAQTGGRPSNTRRSTAILSLTPTNSTSVDENDKNVGLTAIFAQRKPILEAMAKGFQPRALKLMVAMSALIHLDDFRRIGTILWRHHLEDNDPKTLSSICFLVMQCAEKNPHDLLASIEVDLQSSSDDTRLTAIRKISTLANSRFQIMSQHVIADRSHRPFKVARPPLPFVSTDMGSGTFVLELDPSEMQDKLPLELRKKLAEIGWEDDDLPVNQQLEWIRTPMSNLPASQVEKLDTSGNAPPSPNLSPLSSPSRSPMLGDKAEELGLLRRNSSSGGPFSSFKRRAVFVPTLLQVLPHIAEMTCDRSFMVAYAARTMIVDLMRNDPGLLTRPVWDFLTGESQDLPTAVATLRAFLHTRRVLPPSMAHVTLNTLAGFLKDLVKQTENAQTLQYFAQTVPIIAKLFPQVYEMSVRDLRRNKVDIFLIPSGSLWFPPSAPPGPMFPRGPGALDNPFEDCKARIVSITLIRISQNVLFRAMIKRNPAEVQAVRKNMTTLVFPSLAGTEETILQLKDFVPSRESSVARGSVTDDEIRGLSLTLSRSFILLVAQIFRSLSRHLNDRTELSVLIESLNRILLTHGNDVNIVAQTLIALMVASTRFRRLFASGGGYTLFMPVLFKVYAESEAHRGIRGAIEYAVNRFYAYHEDTFIFQSLDAIARILVLPDIDQVWIVKSVYTLFATLRRNHLLIEPDIAGIHHANKEEEREALMVLTAEEKPQTFFASLRSGGGQSQPHTPKSPVTIELPVEYESKHLEMGNFIRLFLTVIAHDLSIARAEQFLKLFRFLVPSFYEASGSARTVLKDGLVALGAILLRPTLPKARAAEFIRQNDTQTQKTQYTDFSKLPSDLASMRMDYLWSLVSYAEIGGDLHSDTVRTAFDLVKAVLRESPTSAFHESVASFLGAFSKCSMMPEGGGRRLKVVVQFLRDLAPILSEYASTIEFTEVYDAIGQLSKNAMYSNDSIFCHLVVNQICVAGLRACDTAASESLLQSLPSRRSLITLISNAILLPGADIFSQLEAHRATHGFLALIILPLALTMKTLAEVDSDGVRLDTVQRTLQARAWSRLLLYVISCCQKTRGSFRDPPNVERSKSQDKRISTARIPSLLVALQVIKVIVIRAGDDLNHGIPDIWLRLAVFLREILGEGNAEFSTRPEELSPNPSPTPSPRSSGQFDMPFSRPMTTALSSVSRSFSSPRIVDYCLWSFLELLCVYRNPLFIQLRAFVHGKVRDLDQELRYQQNPRTPISSRSRRPSSVFTKSRRRISNISGANSPEASPRSTSLATPEMSFSGKFSTYQNLPTPSPFSYSSSPDPSSQNAPGPRIVHLGLISSTSTFRRSLSPGGTSAMRHLAKSTKVKSLILIRKTYLRIRVVQTCMGYQSELLPLPQTSIDSVSELNDSPTTTPWTKRRALQEVTHETRELLAEFEESNELESEGVIVNEFNAS